MLLDAPPASPAPVAVISVGGVAEEAAALDAMQALRGAGIRAEMAYRGNLKRRMERANRIGARAAVIIGEAELARGVAQLKDLETGAQSEVALAETNGENCHERQSGLQARPHRRAGGGAGRDAERRAGRRRLLAREQGAVGAEPGRRAYRRAARGRAGAG